jgi:DNA-binding CsgD family transcriptional regulator
VTSAHQPPPAKSTLTARQREVLELVARGKTNFEIAQALGLSLEGAKYHVREILGRLGANSREEAVALWARERGGHRRWPIVLVAAVAGVGLAAGVVALVVVTLPNKHGGEAEVVAPGEPACATPHSADMPDGADTEVDWWPFLRLHGASYQGLPDDMGPTGFQQLRLGKRVGTVLWDVAADGVDPCHANLDGAAAFLPPGTEIFELPGYAPSLRVVAVLAAGERQLYEAVGHPGARVGADVLDLRGKVTAVEVRSVPWREPNQRPAAIAVIRDAGELREMERLIAEAPVEEFWLDLPPMLELSFLLADGSTIRRVFGPAVGMDSGLRLADAFDQIVMRYVVLDFSADRGAYVPR